MRCDCGKYEGDKYIGVTCDSCGTTVGGRWKLTLSREKKWSVTVEFRDDIADALEEKGGTLLHLMKYALERAQ